MPKTICLLMTFLLTINAYSQSIDLFTQWSEYGPGGKEHSVAWIDKNSYYMVGGFGFKPFQGVSSNELWQLDLNDKTWTELPTIGNSPVGDIRGVQIGDKNEVLVLANSPVMFGARNISLLYKLKVKDGIGHWETIEYNARTQQEGKDANIFLTRNSMLTSIIYDHKKNIFYSICALESCDVFKITLEQNNAFIEIVPTNGEKPNSAVGFAYGYSNKNSIFIMNSGQAYKADGSSTFPNDIWLLDFTKNTPYWTKVSNISTGRRNPCFGFHQKKQELLIWGGTNDGVTSITGVESFKLEDQKISIHLSPSTDIDRSSCFSAYSNKTGILTGFGNSLDQTNNIKAFKDLWQYK